jgi:P-type Ca2+ transporter type 2C
VTTGVSPLLIILATVLGPCQAILATTALDVHQWLLCLGAAPVIVAVSEIRKVVLRLTGATAHPE